MNRRPEVDQSFADCDNPQKAVVQRAYAEAAKSDIEAIVKAWCDSRA